MGWAYKWDDKENVESAAKEAVRQMNDTTTKLDLSDIRSNEKEIMLHFDADKDVKIRDTICNNCIHNAVCKYKNAYLGYLMALESVQKDTDWQFAPHASCGHQLTRNDPLDDPIY